MDYDAPGRHCFQTTYLNERWREYLDPSLNFRMVWTLRNPHSVVYSMVHNWRRFALNEVFLACGFAHMDARDRVRFQRFGIWGIPPVRRAAYAYVGKLAQLEPLAQALGNRLTVVEYDRLVARKSDVLPQLYERLNLRYQPHYVDGVSDRSVRKQDMLRQGDRAEIAVRCDGAYRQACSLLNLGTSS